MWAFIKKIFIRFYRCNIFEHAAALAYATVFSLAPSLLIIVGLCGLIFGDDAAQGRVFEQISRYIGTQEALAVQDIIKEASFSKGDVLSTVVGFALLLFGATTGFTQLKGTLNIIWSAKSNPKIGGIARFLLTRFVSLLLILSAAFLIVISSLTSALLAGFGGLISNYLVVPETLLSLVNGVVSFLVIAAFFTIIYKFLPDIRIPWLEAFSGAVVTSILFVVGKAIVTLYIANSNVSRTYGTAASVVVILLGIYYTSLVIFLGAVFTHEYGELRRERAAIEAVRGESAG